MTGELVQKYDRLSMGIRQLGWPSGGSGLVVPLGGASTGGPGTLCWPRDEADIQRGRREQTKVILDTGFGWDLLSTNLGDHGETTSVFLGKCTPTFVGSWGGPTSETGRSSCRRSGR